MACQPMKSQISSTKLQINPKFEITMTETNCSESYLLFEPALVRLVWCIPLSVSGLELAAINTSGVNSVWARDLDFWSLDIICNLRFVICYLIFTLLHEL
jgi:hypothetical protein